MRKLIARVSNSTDQSITISLPKNIHSMIWLHGLGSTPSSFVPYFTGFNSPLYSGMNFKLLHAPVRKITVNQHHQMPAWYNLKSLDRFQEEEQNVIDYWEINEAANIIHSAVQEEIKVRSQDNTPISPHHRIFIGGFSQGAVMALHYALTATLIPAAAIISHGYLLKYTNPNNLFRIPILLINATNDHVILEPSAFNSFARILQDQRLVQYHRMEKGRHIMGTEHLKLISKWAKDVNKFIADTYSMHDKSSGEIAKKS